MNPVVRRPQAGFSLIELLVAVLVVVLLTGVVALGVGSGGRDIEVADEARLLAATLAYAQSEAELAGADHGLFLSVDVSTGERRYRGDWLRRFDQGWFEPRGSTEVLAPFQFADGVELTLSLDGQADAELAVPDDELLPVPQIVLFAGGEVTPGEIDWHDRASGELLYRLRWDLFGRSELLPRGEEPDA